MIWGLGVGQKRERREFRYGGVSGSVGNGVVLGDRAFGGKRPQTKVVSRRREQVSRLLLRGGRFPEQARHRVGMCSLGDFLKFEVDFGGARLVDIVGRRDHLGIEDLDLEGSDGVSYTQLSTSLRGNSYVVMSIF